MQEAGTRLRHGSIRSNLKALSCKWLVLMGYLLISYQAGVKSCVMIYAQSEGIIQATLMNFQTRPKNQSAEFFKILAGKIHPECTDKDAGNTSVKLLRCERNSMVRTWVLHRFSRRLHAKCYVDGTFRPEADISFVEAAKLISYQISRTMPPFSLCNRES